MSNSRHRFCRRFTTKAMLAVVFSTTACSSDKAPTVVVPLPVTTVAITAAKVRLEVGEQLAVTALARDSRDSLVTDAVLVWSTSPVAVATVMATATGGTVTGVAPGIAIVTVTSGAVSAMLTLDVVPARVATVKVTANGDRTLARSQTAMVLAEIRDARQGLLAGVPVVWTSSDTRIVTVNNTGLVSALAPGQAYAVAQADGVRDSVLFTVSAENASLFVVPNEISVSVGQQRNIAARMRAADGTVTAATSVTWTTGNPLVATVANGVVQAVAPGITTVTAVAGSQTSVVAVRVGLSYGVRTVSGVISAAQSEIRADSIYVVGLVSSGPLTLISAGDIVIVDSLIAPCYPLTLIAGGRVIHDRGPGGGNQPTLSNSCLSDATPSPAPAIRIEAAGGYRFNNARIRSSGDISITNDAALTDANFAGAAFDQGIEACALINFNAFFITARNGNDGAIGENGRDGNRIDISCRGTLRTEQSNINVSGGSNGGNGTHSTLAIGGNGGRSGTIRFRVTGNLIVDRRRLYFRVYASGDGGNATVSGTGTTGVPATAIAGSGGDMGWPGRPTIEFRLLGDLINNDNPSFNALEFGVFIAGKGGNALAIAEPGANATATQPAGAGGASTAIAGRGGRVFPIDATVKGAAASNALLQLGSPGGPGGVAESHAGNGGSGSAEFPNGGPGGAVRSEGGAGGITLMINSPGGSPATGGNAGLAILRGGNGGNGFSRCAPAGVGGIGGAGGRLSGVDGLAGTGQVNGASATLTIESAANGGAGGSGSTPGAGGAKGVDATTSIGAKTIAVTALVNGAAGQLCN